MSTRGRKPKRKRGANNEDDDDDDPYANCSNGKPTKSPKRKHQPLHKANVGGSDREFVDRILEDWAGKRFVGARVAKPFGSKAKLKWFYGTCHKFEKEQGVASDLSKTWHITFDDGDTEEMDQEAFGHWLLQYNILWANESKTSSIPYKEETSAEVVAAAKQQGGKPRGSKSGSAAKKKKGAASQHPQPQQNYYKVIWKLSKKLVEFSDHAFDDCSGSEAVDKAKTEYREAYEFDIPQTQKKELFTSATEANAVGADTIKLFGFQYQLEEDDKIDDIIVEEIPKIIKTSETKSEEEEEEKPKGGGRGKRKRKQKQEKDDPSDNNNGENTTDPDDNDDGFCKKWSWSYSWEDDHDNIFSCEGYVQVKQI